MYILDATWFSDIFREMFYLLDKVIYGLVPEIYDLLISIARTSVLTQGDISQMADRIYKLLAIFMIFKVTLSLITYIVNPDDFSDKTKGVAKLGTNIVISLALLILTPYAFNYAFKLQTIVLEDNALATLIFGYESDDNFLNTAGQDMAFITMSAFFSPNTSLTELYECTNLIKVDSNGNRHFNEKCSGLSSSDYEDMGLDDSMMGLVDNDGPNALEAVGDATGLKDYVPDFSEQELKDYVRGVEASSFGLMFRKSITKATAKVDSGKEYVIDYKYGFSTVVGVVIVLLLITFCMDVAMRSIKLAFLQLMAPIPIISYVDPKSGKDGLFKKWYQMCFKTFLSLFVRLLALYFAIFIISKVADGKMVDIIDGSYVSNCFIAIFIIIGALMFAKQLPKILEGLGIKLDGDGKFFLNPLKKFEEQAAGGKRITGAAGGMVAGAVGGRGFFGRVGSALTGSVRGFNTNKGYKGGLARQADVNRKLREARINGAGFFGTRAAVLSNRYGLDDAGLEREATRLRRNERTIELARREVDASTKNLEAEKKAKQDSIHVEKRKISDHKRMQDAVSKMEERAKSEIQNGNGGSIGRKYLEKKATAEYYENNIGKTVDINGTETKITPALAAKARQDANSYLNDKGMKEYMSMASTGKFDDGSDDKTFQNSYKTYVDAAAQIGVTASTDGNDIHKQYGESKGTVGDIERDIAPIERAISDLDDQIRNIQVHTEVKLEGASEKMSLEEAENAVKVSKQELEDKKKQSQLNRETAKNSSLGGGS